MTLTDPCLIFIVFYNLLPLGHLIPTNRMLEHQGDVTAMIRFHEIVPCFAHSHLLALMKQVTML